MSEECDAGIDGGCGACEKCDPEFWIHLAKEETKKLEAENSELTYNLKEAVRLLKEGKRLFAPNTTNSDVDVFLDKPSIKMLIAGEQS